MKKQIVFCKYNSLIVAALFFLVSCDRNKDVPFPENPSGYKVPVALPFEFPEAKPFQWKIVPTDSIPKGVTTSFDFNKLPSKPFSINDFKPLKSPISSAPLNWSKLPEVKINLDTIKARPVRLTKFMLPKPTITRLNPPTKWEGTTSGILKLGQDEGLIGNLIYAMVADSFGSVWISSERGLSKYNGDVFESYNFLTKSPEGNQELILDIEIDKGANIWLVANLSGIYKINTSTCIVEHFDIGKSFFRIQKDHMGKIWVTNFEKGIFFLDPTNRLLKQLILPIPKFENNYALGVFEDSKNNLWIGYRNKLALLNPERTSIRLIGKTEGLTTIITYHFTEDAKGNIWFSSFTEGATSISLKEDKIFTLGVKQGFSGYGLNVVSDPLNRIWIMSYDEVTIFDPASSLIKIIPKVTTFIYNNFTANSFVDQNGNIWIGTSKNGILIVDSKGTLSEHFNTSNGLASNNVWGILEDKYQRVWLATHSGINIYDPATEKLYLLEFPDKQNSNYHHRLSLLDEDHILLGSQSGFSIIDIKNNAVTSYQTPQSMAQIFRPGLYDQEGNLWIGSDKGVFKFNRDNNQMWKVDLSSGLTSNSVRYLIPDQEGKIWFGSNTGVNVIDPIENTMQYLGKNNGLTSDYASIVFKTGKGEMVVGGDKGFSLIDLQKKTITNVGLKEGLVPEMMYDMTELNGRIHIGSENGLIIVDRPEDQSPGKPWRFTNFNKQEGLPYNDYNQGTAQPTTTGQGWFGAAPILTVTLQDPLIDYKAPKVYITDFNIMDQNPSFIDMKYLNSTLMAKDTLWNSDRTRNYQKDAFPKDSSYLSQNNISWDSLSPSYHIPIGLKLPYNQNSFNFSFANLDIKGRDKIVYRYILEGAEETWSEVSSKSVSKNYYNIKPGKYTFKVATRGFNGTWSKPAELSFTVLPPWWLTWWAYSIYGILFIAGVLIAHRFQKQRLILIERGKAQIRELEQAKEIEKAYTELKSTQAQLIQSEKMASLGELTAGIAHEIQNPLNFVNNFSELSKELIGEMNDELVAGNWQLAKEIAGEVEQNLEKINHHGKRAADIVKGMLQHSRTSSGVKEPTDINALADEYLRLAYHGLRAKDKAFNADFKTEFDETLPKINVIPQDIGRVLLNLINNAFYAVQAPPPPEGGTKERASDYKPTVIVKTSSWNPPSGGRGALISVSDNGPGIPKEIKDKIFQPFFTTKPTGQGTGLGLSLAYDIVKAHGGELKVETKEGEGSEFQINLPIQII